MSLSIHKDYIPFGKPNFSDEEIEAVSRVIRTGWIGMGPETHLFEKEISEYLTSSHFVSVDTCTSALFLSLLVNGIRPGDEVICPSMTWCSTANAALYLGAKPVFCDVDSETISVTIDSVLEKITRKTKAVIVVHMGGLAVDVEALKRALPNGIALIEDAAHALGSKYPNGLAVGGADNLACFSFYANKNLSSGEGGGIALPDEDKAEHLKVLRLHGLPVNAWNRFSNPNGPLAAELTELGYKSNYTDLQAAIARVQLRRQNEFKAIRDKISSLYQKRLSQIDAEIKIQSNVTHEYHSKHLFLIQTPAEKLNIGRDDFIRRLRSRNIGASIHYLPLHKMPLYKYEGFLPATEQLNERLLTLPIGGAMTIGDAEYIMDHFQDVYKTCLR